MDKIKTNTDLFGDSVLRNKDQSSIVADFEERKGDSKKSVLEELSGPQEIGTRETIAKFKPTSILRIDKYSSNGKRLTNDKRNENLLNQGDNGNYYNGYLSPAAVREVKKRLDNWLTAIDIAGKVKDKAARVRAKTVLPTFVTLTLPAMQMHTDYQVKKYLLDPFLSWLKVNSDEVYHTGSLRGEQKGFGVHAYLWRAEPQKNGNIHFHIICDRYIPWKRIRARWNDLLSKMGYLDMYQMSREWFFKDGFRVNEYALSKDVLHFLRVQKKAAKARRVPDNCSEYMRPFIQKVAEKGVTFSESMVKSFMEKKQYQLYEKGIAEGWTDPNSIDIKKINSVKSIALYITKYLTKKPTEIKKKLQPNQVIRYSEFHRRDCIYTYTQETDPDSGRIREREDIRYVELEFEERMIDGKIWGCSDALTPKKTATVHKDIDGSVFYESKDGFTVKNTEKDFIDSLQAIDGSMFYVSDDGKRYHISPGNEDKLTAAVEVKPYFELNYFTKILEERAVFRTEWTPTQDSQVYESSESAIVDKEAHYYVNTMISIIGKERIDIIANKIGDSFKAMNGAYIPLESDTLGYKLDPDGRPPIVPHFDILKDCSVPLAEEYEAHYTNIFNQMYPNAA